MHATIRRYDGVDQNRTAELTSKVKETLVPKLSKLPGFAGYYLIEDGNGVFSSVGLFETPEQGKESSNIVATWIRDEKLDTMLPNEPKITSGKVVAHSERRRGRVPPAAAHSTEGSATPSPQSSNPVDVSRIASRALTGCCRPGR